VARASPGCPKIARSTNRCIGSDAPLTTPIQWLSPCMTVIYTSRCLYLSSLAWKLSFLPSSHIVTIDRIRTT
jgi:hypothetical protein